MRALLTGHRELGTAIISVQEFKAIYAGDLGPEFLIFLGAFRGYGAGAVSNMIALRKAVFEWEEESFSETKYEWHIVADLAT